MLSAGEQAANVGVMLDDNEARHDELYSDEECRSRSGDREPRKDGKACRTEDRRKRDVAGKCEYKTEERDGGQCREGSGDQKYAESRGHSFAAFEPKPDGEHVADDGAKSGER